MKANKMTIKFENLSQEQTDVVIRIVRILYTFYIKQKIESIMFGFSSITRKQFFNQPFEKTFDFETFENMIKNCIDDYAEYQQYKWDLDDEDRSVFTVFKEHVLPFSVKTHVKDGIEPFNCEKNNA
jgi:hypothetical protein